MNLKRYSIKYGAITAMVYGFVMVPMPMTTGNVTGARWVYNLYADLKTEIKLVDSSSRERDIQSLIESRADSQIQDYRFQMMLLELQVERTKPGDDDKLKRLNKRIDRLYDKIDHDGIRRDDIRSLTNQLYIVKR